ncbi:helix-turn-helix domain-containing protein (plasmid) [Clostridium perfringens]
MNNRLRELRKSHGMSQKEFGDILNISQNHVSALENGSREITSRLINDICSKFCVNKDWFLNGKGNMFKDIKSLDDIEDPEIKEFAQLFAQADSETRKYIIGLIKKTLH